MRIKDMIFLYHDLGYSVKAISEIYSVSEYSVQSSLGEIYDPNVISCISTTDIMPEDVTEFRIMYDYLKTLSSGFNDEMRKSVSWSLPMDQFHFGKQEPWKFEKYTKLPEWFHRFQVYDLSDEEKVYDIIQHMTTIPAKEVISKWNDHVFDAEAYSDTGRNIHNMFISSFVHMCLSGLDTFMTYATLYYLRKRWNNSEVSREYVFTKVRETKSGVETVSASSMYRWFLNYYSDIPMYGDIVATCYTLVRESSPVDCLVIDDIFDVIEKANKSDGDMYINFLKSKGCSLANIYSKEIRYLYKILGYSVNSIQEFYNIPAEEIYPVISGLHQKKETIDSVVHATPMEISLNVLNSGDGDILYRY